MSAESELLYRAAALMRERARRACANTWRNNDGQIAGNGARIADVALCQGHDSGDHIASWHPAVALAVAELLDTYAEYDWTDERHRYALGVARAYLGEAS